MKDAQWQCPICLRVVESDEISGCANGHPAAVLIRTMSDKTETPEVEAAKALSKRLGGLHEWTATEVQMVASIIAHAYLKQTDQLAQWREVLKDFCKEPDPEGILAELDYRDRQIEKWREVAGRLAETLRSDKSFLNMYLTALVHVDVMNERREIINGFAAAQIPDWHMKQRIDDIEHFLSAYDALAKLSDGGKG